MKINILIVGAGMYVCGRGTDGFGTLLPAVLKAAKQDKVNKIAVAATSSKSIKEFQVKNMSLQTVMNVVAEIETFPKNENDPNCYLQAAKALNSEKGPKVALISTPDHTHYEITKNLIELGYHCLVVKPLTDNKKQAKELAQLANDSKIYGAVEFHKRFDRSNRKLKDVIASGNIGSPLYFIVEYSQRFNIPTEVFKSWCEKTNIFQYLGVHYVDIVYFATKAKPKRAMALGEKNKLISLGFDSYDSVHAIIEWELNGENFTSHFHTNWIDPLSTTSMSDQRIKLIGTNGRYEADQKDRGIEIVSSNGVEHFNPDFCQFYQNGENKEIEGYGIESVLTFFDDVIRLNENKITLSELNKQRPSFQEAVVSCEVIEMVNKSLEQNGAWINYES